MSFGARLRSEREQQGLTLRAAAAAAGVNAGSLWYLEDGGRQPVTGLAESAASALGLDVADLLLEGPALFEVEFDIGCVSLPDSPWPERQMLGLVPDSMRPRVSVWPWVGDGRLRFRARASCLPGLAALTGSAIPGVVDRLPAPQIRPVRASADLSVLVLAPGPERVQREVLRRTTPVDCCPPIEIVAARAANTWLARLRGVPDHCSVALQRLVPGSPFGLFVPG